MWKFKLRNFFIHIKKDFIARHACAHTKIKKNMVVSYFLFPKHIQHKLIYNIQSKQKIVKIHFLFLFFLFWKYTIVVRLGSGPPKAPCFINPYALNPPLTRNILRRSGLDHVPPPSITTKLLPGSHQ